ANLRAMREASAAWREDARSVLCNNVPERFAFVGNIANGMYERARSFVEFGANIHVFGFAGDDAVFSDPRWAEYDGELPADISWLGTDKGFLQSIKPIVPYAQFTLLENWGSIRLSDLPPYARPADFLKWPGFFSHLPALEALQAYDAIYAVQA